jgi:hypothetical protein
MSVEREIARRLLDGMQADEVRWRASLAVTGGW